MLPQEESRPRSALSPYERYELPRRQVLERTVPQHRCEHPGCPVMTRIRKPKGEPWGRNQFCRDHAMDGVSAELKTLNGVKGGQAAMAKRSPAERQALA